MFPEVIPKKVTAILVAGIGIAALRSCGAETDMNTVSLRDMSAALVQVSAVEKVCSVEYIADVQTTADVVKKGGNILEPDQRWTSTFDGNLRNLTCMNADDVTRTYNASDNKIHVVFDKDTVFTTSVEPVSETADVFTTDTNLAAGVSTGFDVFASGLPDFVHSGDMTSMMELTNSLALLGAKSISASGCAKEAFKSVRDDVIENQVSRVVEESKSIAEQLGSNPLTKNDVVVDVPTKPVFAGAYIAQFKELKQRDDISFAIPDLDAVPCTPLPEATP